MNRAVPRRLALAGRLTSLAATLYPVSLVLPAFAVKSSLYESGYWGIHCLLFGWFYWLGWIANPLLLIAVIFYRRGARDHGSYALAVVFAGCAVASAASAPFLLAGDGSLRHPHVGYFAWAGSMVAVLVAAAIRAAPRTPLRE